MTLRGLFRGALSDCAPWWFGCLSVQRKLSSVADRAPPVATGRHGRQRSHYGRTCDRLRPDRTIRTLRLGFGPVHELALQYVRFLREIRTSPGKRES